MDEIKTLKRSSLSKSNEVITQELNKPKKPDGGYG